MPDDTLARWGHQAKQHVRLTDTHVVLGIDEDKVEIGPFPDATARKAAWSDLQWIVARIMETTAEGISANYERTDDLILSAERLVALLRGVVEYGSLVARSSSLDLCIAAYDLAKARLRAPSAYDRIRNPNALEGEPEPEAPPAPEKQQGKEDIPPSLPEPETEALYQVLFHWRKRLQNVDKELERLKLSFLSTDPNPNAPCPPDLARAYSRHFKVLTVVHYLESAIHEQVAEHHAQRTTEGEYPTEMRFNIRTVVVTADNPPAGVEESGPTP